MWRLTSPWRWEAPKKPHLTPSWWISRYNLRQRRRMQANRAATPSTVRTLKATKKSPRHLTNLSKTKMKKRRISSPRCLKLQRICIRNWPGSRLHHQLRTGTRLPGSSRRATSLIAWTKLQRSQTSGPRQIDIFIALSKWQLSSNKLDEISWAVF